MTKYIYHEEAPCTVLLKMAKLPPTFNTTPSFRPINLVQCPCQGLHYFRRRRENTTSILEIRVVEQHQHQHISTARPHLQSRCIPSEQEGTCQARMPVPNLSCEDFVGQRLWRGQSLHPLQPLAQLEAPGGVGGKQSASTAGIATPCRLNQVGSSSDLNRSGAICTNGVAATRDLNGVETT